LKRAAARAIARRVSARFDAAVAAFDAQNAADPRLLDDRGKSRPRELVDAERLSAWVDRLDPAAPEALRLAARCQHIRRWEIPRSSYAAGRQGYLEWRKALARFHADLASKVLRQVGYDDTTIEQVRRINLKRELKSDPLTQTMEDALCLTFIEHELEEFAAVHSPEQVVDILQKTWRKMSERGRSRALEIELAPDVRALVERALPS
jgi:Domain of unknown function (DUF4202)